MEVENALTYEVLAHTYDKKTRVHVTGFLQLNLSPMYAVDFIPFSVEFVTFTIE